MKFILAPIFFFFINNCFSQQLLMKVEMENNFKSGYGLEMYFVFNNLDELKSSVSSISHFTERAILNAFDYPLVEPGLSLGICDSLDNIRKRNSDFIQKYRSISLEKNELKVSISISSAFVEYCVFDLPNKFWGSYDVSFKKAAVIVAYRKVLRKIPKTTLIEIKNLFNKIPSQYQIKTETN